MLSMIFFLLLFLNKERMNWSKYEINLVYFSRLHAIHQKFLQRVRETIEWREKIKEWLLMWESVKIKIEEWKITEIWILLYCCYASSLVLLLIFVLRDLIYLVCILGCGASNKSCLMFLEKGSSMSTIWCFL